MARSPEPGNHGTTFGGNPVACAAALAVLDTIEKDHLLDHVNALGKTLRDGLPDPRVVEIRGEGLMIGLDLTVDAPSVVTAAMASGFILNATGPSTIRLVPPLVLTDADAHSLIDARAAILGASEVSA
nr:aminotransferase class III-fold pyridoxal phosphate-dependent enzyme [Nocardioides sp. B-3]